MFRENDLILYRIGDWLKAWARPELLWWLVAAGAIVLRLRQYLLFLSFGNDDAALALNIAERTFDGLTRPLDYHQGAPILFLFIQKALIKAFGNQDFILEIFPFIAALLAIHLFYRIAREHFGMAGVFAAIAFAIAPSLVLYASNPKQYSSDATIALVLVYLATRCLDDSARVRDYLVLGLTGAVVIWVSHPSALMLAGIGLALAFEKLRRKEYAALAWCVAMGAAWAVSLGIDYVLSLRNLAADPYLTKYWQSAFVPLPPWSKPLWFVDTYLALLDVSLGTTAAFAAIACFFLTLVGVVSLLMRKRALALVIVLPFMMALIASVLQKYPLQYRFLVFLAPFIYLLMAEGVSRIYSLAAGVNRALALGCCAAICLIVLSPAMLAAKRNFLKPERLWDMRAAVEFIGKNWQEGDTVLVSGGGETFAYYALSEGLNARDTLIDSSHRIIRYRTFMEDLEMLKGKDRVWIVFAHFEKGGDYTRYASYVGKHSRIENVFQTGYARVYLSDLTR